jgi:hypothetical protein
MDVAFHPGPAPLLAAAGLCLAGGLKRAEIWTVAGGADYTGKARPAIIVEDDRFDTERMIVSTPTR